MCDCRLFNNKYNMFSDLFFQHFGSTFRVIFIILCVLQGFALSSDHHKKELIEDNVQNYLMQFGYLSPSPAGAGALRTEESVRQAIKELQEFSGLPITGRLDQKTKTLLRTPRCGVPDIQPHSMRRKRFMIQGQRWPYNNITWSLRSTYLRDLDRYQVRYVFTKALEVWSKHSRLTFTEVDSDRADILVYFHRGEHGDNFAFDGRGQVLAHAFFPGSGRGGDAHFDLDENWLTREDDNSDGTSLFHVAAHEFGHSLGLSHSSVEGALMFPWYQGMQNGFNYELPEDDRLGIQALYGSIHEQSWGQRPVYQPPPQPAPRPSPPPTTRPTIRITRPPVRPERPVYSYPNNPQRPHNPKKPHTEKPIHKKPMHPDRKYNSKNPYNPYDPNRNSPPKPFPRPDQTPERRYPQKPEITTHPERYPERRPNINRASIDRPNIDRPNYDPQHNPKESGTPDTCDTSYDAISVVRGEVFIFKNRYLWRITDKGLTPGYPADINRIWGDLPDSVTHIDAVYERPDNKMVFFIGRNYYVYSGNNRTIDSPKPLTNLGLPASLNKIDGAMVWGHNGKTYFFAGNMYWRFDEDLQKVELDYPRNMSMWKGVGTDIDAVFQWKDGKTYFFKGKGFWKFNDLRMRVEHEEQTLSAPFWMGCSRNIGLPPGNKAPYTNPSASSAKILTSTVTLVVFSTILKIFFTLIT
ncbi:hypothetical protein FQA39_LY00179 [Lamprigera yunnana]|nr:hypothetical protein FQA39_LY00179 [Lamprigera yunnana]